jgi:hypothetical protein
VVDVDGQEEVAGGIPFLPLEAGHELRRGQAFQLVAVAQTGELVEKAGRMRLRDSS